MAAKKNTRSYGKPIKNISEFFTPFEGATPLPYIILIEGAPGIGKTILSKEIALQWANRVVLQSTKLLLLIFMSDPQVKNITGIASLVTCFCEGNALVDKITEWLVKTDGKYLTVILDGYDEVSEGNKSFFISDIISRKRLTKCGLVITSRPTASSHLHHVADCRAEVLGFTEEDRLAFIQSAFGNEIEKIKELDSFLHSNPFLNTLCYVPLNMSILLCLTENGVGSLPKTQTKLFEKFVVMTIVHFLKKHVKTFTVSVITLNDLPPPYDQAVKELSQFAFVALRKDKLVFTVADIKVECPNLTPANWYKLGLLKLAKYFESQRGCDQESFHFLHFAIQEYMAANHIASLPDKEQLMLLSNTFWNVHYFNTWIMYFGITGGNRFDFKHFLSSNRLKRTTHVFKRSNKSCTILNHKMKCLHLLHCSAEIDSDDELLSIENIFQGETIDLSHQSLSPNDVHTLAVLLLRSPNKQWEMINLSHCNIDDKCCDVLCEMFCSQSKELEVKQVDFSYNNIQWESICKVSDVWNIKELILPIDSLYDGATMDMINKFNVILRNAIPSDSVASWLDEKLLVTYMLEEGRIGAMYAREDCIICTQFTGCNLDHNMIELLKKRFGITKLASVELIIPIIGETANTKLSSLPAKGLIIKFSGSNIYGKGAYVLDNASIIDKQSNPLEKALDYLTTTIYHSNQLHLNTTATSSLNQIIINLKNFAIVDCMISDDVIGDISSALSQNTQLQQLYLGGNNLQSVGATRFTKCLQKLQL